MTFLGAQFQRSRIPSATRHIKYIVHQRRTRLGLADRSGDRLGLDIISVLAFTARQYGAVERATETTFQNTGVVSRPFITAFRDDFDRCARVALL